MSRTIETTEADCAGFQKWSKMAAIVLEQTSASAVRSSYGIGPRIHSLLAALASDLGGAPVRIRSDLLHWHRPRRAQHGPLHRRHDEGSHQLRCVEQRFPRHGDCLDPTDGLASLSDKSVDLPSI